jgi:hypothetical protein
MRLAFVRVNLATLSWYVPISPVLAPRALAQEPAGQGDRGSVMTSGQALFAFFDTHSTSASR